MKKIRSTLNWIILDELFNS